jgi:uncharacterized protein YprB with RNaseH-like and TPR domain
LIKHTFIHIAGIGSKTERGLWKRGILTWEDFLEHRKPVFTSDRDAQIRQELEASLGHQKDIHFFLNRLPQAEYWRLVEPFQDKAVFLDIETSGGYEGLDEITVIGLYNGQEVKTFIHGQNLEEFEQALDPDSFIITFNGSCFDLPYIKRTFPLLNLPPAHLDLRFLLKKLGLGGGLKAIEKKLGLSRDPAVEGLNGFDAALLWNAYLWGDESALDRLILYNTMDIIMLKPLMDHGAQEMKRRFLGDIASG